MPILHALSTFTGQVLHELTNSPNPRYQNPIGTHTAKILTLHSAGLAIPDDVAIVGVDDNTEICEESSPTLSSIRLDHLESGRLSAQLLDRLMSMRTRKPMDVTYPCAEIVTRESTRRFTHSEKLISEVVERIRKESCLGLSAAEIIKSIPCSRRIIEIRFRKATGRSFLEEIRNTRLSIVSGLNMVLLSFAGAASSRMDASDGITRDALPSRR